MAAVSSMSTCSTKGNEMKWDDSLSMNRVPNVAVGTISEDMMMEEGSASDATMLNEQLTFHEIIVLNYWMRNLYDFPTIADITSVKPVSSGSPAFMWTYQQLSETDWSGAHLGNSSSTNSEIVGRLVISGKEVKARTLHLETLMSASTSTAPMKRKAWEELQELQQPWGEISW